MNMPIPPADPQAREDYEQEKARLSRMVIEVPKAVAMFGWDYALFGMASMLIDKIEKGGAKAVAANAATAVFYIAELEERIKKLEGLA